MYLSKEACACKLTEHAVYDRVIPDVRRRVDEVSDLQRSAVLAYGVNAARQITLTSGGRVAWSFSANALHSLFATTKLATRH